MIDKRMTDEVMNKMLKDMGAKEVKKSCLSCSNRKGKVCNYFKHEVDLSYKCPSYIYQYDNRTYTNSQDKVNNN